MVQSRVRPAILFGFFWVAIRWVLQPRAVPGENGVDQFDLQLGDPKHANPAIKVLWSSKAGTRAG
jgi:hypothetical protein